jgi:hypothetical protein
LVNPALADAASVLNVAADSAEDVVLKNVIAYSISLLVAGTPVTSTKSSTVARDKNVPPREKREHQTFPPLEISSGTPRNIRRTDVIGTEPLVIP